MARGGKRKGAGRPKGSGKGPQGVTVAVYLPKDVAAWLRVAAHENIMSMSEFVTAALRAAGGPGKGAH